MIDVKDLAGLSEPAKTLIERVSDMFGAVFHPYQISRIANAEAKADIIKARSQVEVDKILAVGKIDVTDEKRRAVRSLVHQEEKNQQNRDKILRLAAPEIKEDAKPEAIEEDWLSNFFDKSRLVSDEQMQILWSRILAGESNEPGTFSKRTVNLLQILDKKDADAFVCLCRFIVNQKDNPECLIYDETNEIYSDEDINYGNILELEALHPITKVGFFRR